SFFRTRPRIFAVMNQAAVQSQRSSIPPASPAIGTPAASHLPLFATPVSMYELPDMDEANRELTARLVAESASVPSIIRSNVGSWHSRPDLAARPESCFRILIQH